MPALHYAKTEGETQEPTGVVIRTLPDGELETQVIKGDNDQVNNVITILAKIIDEIGMEAFLPMAQSAASQAGFDVDKLLAQANADD